VSGTDVAAVRRSAAALAVSARQAGPPGCVVLGPAPAPLARLKNAHRWHVLVKGPAGSDLPSVLRDALAGTSLEEGVSVAPDVDPVDLM
jgi:primosomal protein N' (replication factor Y)